MKKNHTGEKPPMFKTCGFSFSLVILKGMKKLTQNTGLMHVRIVKKPSAALVILPDMKCFTLVGSLMLLVSTVDNLHYLHFAQE